jgi:sugar/nucleoside kinase (ribokinase family)
MNEPKIWNSTQANPTILELARKINERINMEFDKWHEIKSETWRNASPYIKYEHMPWDELREILKTEDNKSDD